MDGRKRTVQIKFRVTEAERDLILEKMKLVPTRNMAAYLRKIAIDGYIIQIDHADIKAMTAEIQKIGVNVNQIARRVNATGNAYQEDIEEIKGVLAEIWRLQRLPDRGRAIKAAEVERRAYPFRHGLPEAEYNENSEYPAISADCAVQCTKYDEQLLRGVGGA